MGVHESNKGFHEGFQVERRGFNGVREYVRGIE